MTIVKYDAMSLKELRKYVLSHREDVEAFQRYVDRSKAEENMISLDLSDEQWEEKVKAAIRCSSEAIRWYPSDGKDDPKFSKIENWWRNLAHKTVVISHITGMEIDRETGIWEPIQLNPQKQVIIREFSIEVVSSTAVVKYIDRDGLCHELEAIAIDLELAKNNFFAWLNSLDEVVVFHF